MSERVGDGEILLGGGGDADDSSPLDEWLVDQIGTDAAMGYIPVAMPDETYLDCERWITSVFERHGLTDIEPWTEPTEVTPKTMANIDAIYVGGGNTYRLLAKLRAASLDGPLREFVLDGGILYGGSAGAIICGATIETTPDENHVEITDPTGFELLPDIDVWCHYKTDDEVSQYATVTGRTTVAIPERSGVSVTATHYTVVGHEPVCVFQDDTKTTYPPGEQFEL
jgi:Peptidase E